MVNATLVSFARYCMLTAKVPTASEVGKLEDAQIADATDISGEPACCGAFDFPNHIRLLTIVVVHRRWPEVLATGVPSGPRSDLRNVR